MPTLLRFDMVWGLRWFFGPSANTLFIFQFSICITPSATLFSISKSATTTTLQCSTEHPPRRVTNLYTQLLLIANPQQQPVENPPQRVANPPQPPHLNVSPNIRHDGLMRFIPYLYSSNNTLPTSSSAEYVKCVHLRKSN